MGRASLFPFTLSGRGSPVPTNPTTGDFTLGPEERLNAAKALRVLGASGHPTRDSDRAWVGKPGKVDDDQVRKPTVTSISISQLGLDESLESEPSEMAVTVVKTHPIELTSTKSRLQLRPSSTIKGQFSESQAPGPMSSVGVAPHHLQHNYSTSTLHSYYDPQSSPLAISQQTSASSARDLALRKGLPVIQAASPGDLQADQTPSDGHDVPSRRKLFSFSPDRKNPPRLDLSKLFPRPRHIPAALLSPDRLTQSPSALSLASERSTANSAQQSTGPDAPPRPTSGTTLSHSEHDPSAITKPYPPEYRKAAAILGVWPEISLRPDSNLPLAMAKEAQRQQRPELKPLRTLSAIPSRRVEPQSATSTRSRRRSAVSNSTTSTRGSTLSPMDALTLAARQYPITPQSSLFPNTCSTDRSPASITSHQSRRSRRSADGALSSSNLHYQSILALSSSSEDEDSLEDDDTNTSLSVVEEDVTYADPSLCDARSISLKRVIPSSIAPHSFQTFDAQVSARQPPHKVRGLRRLSHHDGTGDRHLSFASAPRRPIHEPLRSKSAIATSASVASVSSVGHREASLEAQGSSSESSDRPSTARPASAVPSASLPTTRGGRSREGLMRKVGSGDDGRRLSMQDTRSLVRKHVRRCSEGHAGPTNNAPPQPEIPERSTPETRLDRPGSSGEPTLSLPPPRDDPPKPSAPPLIQQIASAIPVSLPAHPSTESSTIAKSTHASQDSALFLLMHHSRVMPSVGGHRYLTSTAVFMAEVVKLAICLTLALYDISRNLPPMAPATSLFTALYNAVFGSDSWKLVIPAVLYTFQNYFQFVALSNTDAATFQVSYQLKILMAALSGVIFLRRGLSARKWAALVLLLVGVASVQIRESSPTLAPLKDAHSRFYFPRSLEDVPALGGGVAAKLHRRSATYEGIQEDQGIAPSQLNPFTALMAVLTTCVLSGLAGVYSESFLKDPSAPTWIRHVQLSFFSLFPALLIGVVTQDANVIAEHGLFHGYNWAVWAVIGTQAGGAVLNVLCMSYVDNTIQNWATTLSILLSFFASIWLSDINVTTNFLLGTCVVLVAIFLFHRPERPRPPPINIADYEKTTIGGDAYDEERLKPAIPRPSSALSTSRPSSPMRHHSRVASGRTKFAKRGD
ncbi:MAG: hypothetical protein M1817_005907 [Caeruleum heppii]|nr:MAG: hypothetical protein M1817_005907 [Caeruleum heppii]